MIRMKNLLIVCAFGFQSLLFSQHRPHKTNPKIERARLEFIQKEMNLDPKISDQFWNLYQNHHQKIRKIFRTQRSFEMHQNLSQLSEKEASLILEKIIFNEKEIEKEKKSFMQEMRTLISDKQILQLRVSERKFRKNLLKKMRK